VVTNLAIGNKLDIKYKDHRLEGNFVKCRELPYRARFIADL